MSPAGTQQETAAERVVTAAIALGRESGTVAGMTMRALALRVGTSATGLYKLHPCKAALMTAARHRALRPLRQKLRAALGAQGPDVALLRWVEAYLTADPADSWIDSSLPGHGPDCASADDAAQALALPALRERIDEADEAQFLHPGLGPSLACWLLWSSTHAVLKLQSGLIAGTPALAGRAPTHPARAVVDGVLRRGLFPSSSSPVELSTVDAPTRRA